MLMIIAILVMLGLALGSFSNALVWRVHEQSKEAGRKKLNQKYLQRLSISKGRSMCPHCKHTLASKDLLPIVSWLSTKGRCRYCGKPISAQYPLIELLTAILFVASYRFWPDSFSVAQTIIFSLWLVLLVGLIALLIYDLRWMLLPNRIVYPLGVVAVLLAAVQIATANHPLTTLINTILAVAVGGGVFYVLFQVSAGKWIGGGDVKLGWLLGLIVGTPARSFLIIFLASIFGVLVSAPLLLSKRKQRDSTIPFGPFLIAGGYIVVLFGHAILHWYQITFLPYTV